MTEVDIACLPKDLPQFIEVDLAELGLGESIHLSQIKIADGIELTPLTHGNDAAVTSISKPRVVVETEEVTAAAEGDEAEATDDSAESTDAPEAEKSDDSSDNES